ncbi:hypothetical protein GH714_015229 [Hevea brasiliensis]|uniref:Glucose-6-phosphate isomerase n=1 Tax=Hevea brasiliensis TaxID=3981 RepID=A0A6A6NHF6_HEVBR|nr:hypothetical protein GH714_015229 [Hevea brasiliensis]
MTTRDMEIEGDLELLIPVAEIPQNAKCRTPSSSSTVGSSSHRLSGLEAISKVVRSWASKKFMTGCVILLPIAVTFYITWGFVHFVDGFFSPVYDHLGINIFGKYNIAGLGFATSITFIFLVGIFMSSWLGASVLTIGEWFIKKMPLVSYIYSSSKQISAAISPDQTTNAFKEVAIIRHPRIGEYAFGFITSTVILQRSMGEEELCCVYVPTNHLYVGDIFLISTKDILRPNLSVREGIEIIISGGMSVPQIMTTKDAQTIPAARLFKYPSSKMASSALICDTQPWKNLKAHVEDIKKTHLRDLLSDTERCNSMMVEFDGIVLDYSRQQATVDTVDKLYNLAEAAHLQEKIHRMFNGERINSTENRSVLHVALRAPRNAVINSDGKNVVPDVWNVLDKIKEFSERVRNGSWVGATGKPLTNVIAIGIGGSFLGPLFVHTALQTDPEASRFAKGRQLQFLANVDPIDVAKNIAGLSPETTLVVVVSKTFTTAETMLNARTLRAWISKELGPSAVAKHMVAVSTNLTLVEKFGIDPNNAFAFWDWVGGRYSVCSAVGVLPLSLQYGFSIVEKFLKGASSIDQHFSSASFEKIFLENQAASGTFRFVERMECFISWISCKSHLTLLPSLGEICPHIQQVSMESNGKGVSIDGVPLPFETGEIDFGEPGTNGQHSFYQLIHQGRVIPCDFIGVVKSQQPVYLEDALAYGKTAEQLQKENVQQHLIPHKTFSGNRPSLCILLSSLDAYRIGQLLAIYEHRVAVQGFIWGINSFDQWGVELGKSLATQVRKQLNASRTKGEPVEGFNFSTTTMLTRYLEESSDVPADPQTLLPRI